MTPNEYEQIGRFIINNLEKLMSGEHQGISVICPIRPKNKGGLCRITIDMPTDVDWVTLVDDKFGIKRTPIHYTWVPSEQSYVNDEFVLKIRKNKKKGRGE